MMFGRHCGLQILVTGEKSFGIGVGTLVLAVNVVLLGGYTFGCHSLRHVVGGFMDRLSGAPVRRNIISVCELFQPEAYAVGMDEFVLGCVFRYLCPFVFDGCVE